MLTEEEICTLLAKSLKPKTIDELLEFLNIPFEEKEMFLQKIEKLVFSKDIFVTEDGKYGVLRHFNFFKGVFCGNRKGFGFVSLAEGDFFKDVYIDKNNTKGAIDGDLVLGKFLTCKGDLKKPQGKILEILQRKTEELVGSFLELKGKSGETTFVVKPLNKNIPNVYVPYKFINGALNKQKVVVKILGFKEEKAILQGQIVEILGNENTKNIDSLVIMRKYNLKKEFDQNVLNELEEIGEEIPQEEFQKRRDLRHLNIFTIDGEDAKDLDDAVSISKLENGNFKLGVHIADVGFYVKEGSFLDKEAFKRGCSVYLIDEVLPMLPKKLSNVICSLNPKKDRLTVS